MVQHMKTSATSTSGRLASTPVPLLLLESFTPPLEMTLYNQALALWTGPSPPSRQFSPITVKSLVQYNPD